MDLAQAVSETLDRLLATGRVEVRENGAWLAAIEDFRYELRQQGDVLLLHLWSAERNAVRRVLRIDEGPPDRLTLEAFQLHQLRNLHDSGFEPAFDLVAIPERPTVATINFADPANRADQMTAALADRCFAASYFRYLRLV